MAGCGLMWQGVRAYDKGFGHMAVGGVCGSGSDLWHKWGHVTGIGACGRVWGHVAGCGVMWQGVEVCHKG